MVIYLPVVLLLLFVIAFLVTAPVAAITTPSLATSIARVVMAVTVGLAEVIIH